MTALQSAIAAGTRDRATPHRFDIVPSSNRVRPPAIHFQVPVPEDEHGRGRDGAGRIVLELDSLGGYWVNRHPVPVESLTVVLHRVFDDRVRRVLHIRAAPNRPYWQVIEAADVAKTAGIWVVGLVLTDDVRSP